MDIPQRNPRRIQSCNSLATNQKIPKQYRVLGLASPHSSSPLTSSIISGSTATLSSSGTSPLPKPQTLSDHLSIFIKHITCYFDLFHSLPLSIIDGHLRDDQPTTTHRTTSIEFLKCLSVLRDTLWSIQAQLKDENPFVRKIFQRFEYRAKKYLTKCLMGWRGVLLIRSCTRHYHSICGIRRVLRKELGDMKDIMDAVGPHCKEMLLDVDIEVVREWLVNLDKSRVLVAQMAEKSSPKTDLNIGNPAFGSEGWDLCVAPPTKSEMTMERTFRRFHLPHYSFSSNRKTGSVSDSEMDRDFASRKRSGRQSYLRASLLALN